mmetsp:Transcript_20316/g.77795  ORF Transcript_20316/g.77795 Transcript_20316/m.77795 type:complete len:209 (+) Transcript_20316:2085-2711(+)
MGAQFADCAPCARQAADPEEGSVRKRLLRVGRDVRQARQALRHAARDHSLLADLRRHGEREDTPPCSEEAAGGEHHSLRGDCGKDLPIQVPQDLQRGIARCCRAPPPSRRSCRRGGHRQREHCLSPRQGRAREGRPSSSRADIRAWRRPHRQGQHPLLPPPSHRWQGARRGHRRRAARRLSSWGDGIRLWASSDCNSARLDKSAHSRA